MQIHWLKKVWTLKNIWLLNSLESVYIDQNWSFLSMLLILRRRMSELQCHVNILVAPRTAILSTIILGKNPCELLSKRRRLCLLMLVHTSVCQAWCSRVSVDETNSRHWCSTVRVTAHPSYTLTSRQSPCPFMREQFGVVWSPLQSAASVPHLHRLVF